MSVFLNQLTLKVDDLGYEPEYLVENVLVKNSLNMYYAKGGSGKSFLALGLSISLIEQKKVQSVIYMDMDNSLVALKKRAIDKLFEKYPELNYIHASKLNGSPMDLLDYLVLQTMNNPNAFNNVLLVFDSIRDFILGRDMNSDREIAPIMQKLKHLREGGATVIFLHHTTKEGDGNNYKGSTSFRDSVDISYCVSSQRSENTLSFSLNLDKDRLGVKEQVGFELDTSTMQMKTINPQMVNMEDNQLTFVKNVQNVLSENYEGISQSDLLTAIGKSNDDKTARKYLKEYSGKLWNSKKVPEQNNKILYFEIVETDTELVAA